MWIQICSSNFFGSLSFIYNSMSNLCSVVGLTSIFLDDPRRSNMIASRRILRYLKSTLRNAIMFPKAIEQAYTMLIRYSNVDCCENKVNRRTTIGYFFKLFDAPISLFSKKKLVAVLSSYESEYAKESHAACKTIFLKSLLKELKSK